MGCTDGMGFTCCPEKEFVQDKLCCDIRLTTTTATTVYILDSSIACAGLFASGMIKNCNTAATDTLTVTFLRGTTTIRTITIPAGGCAAFTVSGFDTINVVAAAATPEVPAIGEICITPRYRIG
ncbi:S-Ena type endospore appendage [Aneurinibacillus aneurinilyticus]|uniref:S-Ena type endospore appendage n=1 Tax=Aneurinibacillus aneurinilyticus TaxID=1391 RepID=UPI0035247F69